MQYLSHIVFLAVHAFQNLRAVHAGAVKNIYWYPGVRGGGTFVSTGRARQPQDVYLKMLREPFPCGSSSTEVPRHTRNQHTRDLFALELSNESMPQRRQQPPAPHGRSGNTEGKWAFRFGPGFLRVLR